MAEWKKLRVQGVRNAHLEIKESPGKGMIRADEEDSASADSA